MKNGIVFGKDEYHKLMNTLGLLDNEGYDDDGSDYFNAWNFGKSERDYEFLITSSIPV